MTSPDDPREVAADEAGMERVRAGESPPLGDPAFDQLARWRAEEHRRPISGWLPDSAEPSGWRWVADVSVVDDTAALPVVGRRVTYGGHHDYLPVVPDDALAGDLGTVGDQEWRDAHQRLAADMPELGDQLAYTWAPGEPAPVVDGPDMAPVDGSYDPGEDERFHGGGFRG